jgi:hypothetical protein
LHIILSITFPTPDFDLRTNNVTNEDFVTISEIVDIQKIIYPYKASGPDKISHKMLKISTEKIAIPLQIIFNKLLRQKTRLVLVDKLVLY